MAEDFILAEKDREFVARVLHDFAKLKNNLADEVAVPEAGHALKRASTRARNLAIQINPVVYDRNYTPPLIMGSKFPFTPEHENT